MADAIDPDVGAHVLLVGRRGSGKSYLARTLFDSYPYPSLVLDVTGDLSADFAADGTELDPTIHLVKITAPMPARLPEPEPDDPRRQVFVFAPDMGAPDALDDVDRLIGLALRRGKMLIWFDEIGVISPPGRTGPNLRRYLHHGRHHDMTGLACGPRPIDIDPLVLSQADLVYVFALANPADRRRVADSIGWEPKDFDEAVHDLAKYEYLAWYSETGDIDHMPPLPRRRRSQLGR